MNWLAVIPRCDLFEKQNWKQTKFVEISFYLTTDCNTWHLIAVCGWDSVALGDLWTNMFHTVKLAA